MKKFLIVLPLTFLLSGCLLTAPVKRNFPEVPLELKTACPDLQTVESTEQLSKVITVVTDNYSKYHECKLKVDMWILWYDKQKEIFDSVK